MHSLKRLGVSFVLAVAATTLVAAQGSEGVDVLLGKARSLEARGRLDLAAQNWNQVLLVNPNQTEALAGLARHAKQSGNADAVRTYLDRLRKLNPGDPAIAAVERMRVLTAQDRTKLDEAGRLAGQQRPDEAMKVYREVFGKDGPWGKWAEPYYQTLAASSGGRPEAIASLRELTSREPGNEVYRLWLARILSYDPKTRVESLRLLESIRDSGTSEQARGIWRQALVWEKENPAVQPSIEAYLKRYPDPELTEAAGRLRDTRERAAQDADKQRGFLALREKDTSTAERQFEDVLRRSPKDLNALVGLGFVRLEQKRFTDAIGLFDKARAMAPSRGDIREGYENARFWSAMERGQAMELRDSTASIAAYEEALALRPQDDQPVLAIAQIMLRREQLADAAVRFEQVLQRSPSNPDAIAGLGFVRLKEKKFGEAVSLLDKARTLAPNRRDVKEGYATAQFWGVMTDASAALDRGDMDAAMKGFNRALSFDASSVDAWLGLAGAAERVRNADVALEAYQRVSTIAPTETRAWLGLIRTQNAARQFDAAAATFRAIPAAVRSKLETRSDYLAQLSLVLFATGHQADGDRVLTQALAAAGSDDSDEALGVRLQIASLLVKQGEIDRALSIYTQTTEQDPGNVIAWQGLVAAYAEQREFDRAIAAVRTMPRATYDAAATNPGFLNAVAAGYAAGGRCREAEQLLTRSLDLERSAGRVQSTDTQLQLADIWMRQGRFAEASQAYRTVVDANPQSIDAWRGYVLALHNRGDDRTIAAELRRMAPAVHTQLARDPGMLTLLATAQSKSGEPDAAVASLEQARSMYQAAGSTPPVDFDLQLGWAMLASSRADAVGEVVARAQRRSDLTADQRAALDELWFASIMSRVDAAVKRNDIASALTLLTGAWRDDPKNPKIPSALAALYMREGQRARALDVYRTWGLTGAEAGDYRAAAGVALAEHDTITADRLMREGLAKFPGDRDLLRMNGRQAVAHGDYREAERLLNAALAARPAAPTAVVPARPPSPRQTLAQEPACSADSATAAPAPGPRVILASLRQAASSSQVEGPSGESAAQQDTTTASPQDPAPQPPVASSQAPQTEEIADDIDTVRNRNTPYGSMGVAFGGRAGDPGLSRLVIRDVAPGAAATIGNTVRMGVDVHSLALTTGTPDGQSGYRFGTLPLGARFAEQRADGYTADVQVSSKAFGVSIGTPPSEFLIKTWTGGVRIGPTDGPVRLLIVRDRVKDSLLSYAGERDPGTGLVWGGVVSNGAQLQMNHDASGNGMYLSLGGAILRGENVQNNWNVDATAGAYWTLGTGGPTSLTLGVAGTAMHYQHNLSFFSLGHGGYFSPQRYIQGSVPLSWTVRHTRTYFELQASPGYQYFNADASPIYPLALGPASIETYETQQRNGANYNFAARLEYRIAPHVHLGAFGAANNNRDFDSRTIGVSLKVLVNRLPATTNLRVRAVPDWRGNQPLGN